MLPWGTATNPSPTQWRDMGRGKGKGSGEKKKRKKRVWRDESSQHEEHARPRQRGAREAEAALSLQPSDHSAGSLSFRTAPVSYLMSSLPRSGVTLNTQKWTFLSEVCMQGRGQGSTCSVMLVPREHSAQVAIQHG